MSAKMPPIMPPTIPPVLICSPPLLEMMGEEMREGMEVEAV